MVKKGESQTLKSRMGERRGDSFFKNTLALVLGNTGSQFVMICMMPVITRIYSPDAIGAFFIIIAMVNIFLPVSTMRYDIAIQLPKEEQDADAIALLCVVLSMLFAALLTATTLFWGETVADSFQLSDGKRILFAVPIIILMLSISQILIPLLLRREKFKAIAIAKVLYSGADTGVSAGVGMCGLNNPYALLLGRFSGLAVQFAALISARGQGSLGGIFSKKSVKRLSGVSRRFKEFPKFVWSPLLQRLGNQLPVLILGAYFSSAVVGYFAFSRRILYEPIEVVGNGIARSYFQKSSKMHREGHELSMVSKRLFQVLVAVVTLPMMLLGIIGDDIFYMFFGSDWKEAGVYTQLLVPLYIATFFFRPFSCLFDVLERQKDAFYFNLAFAIVTVAAIYAGCMAGNPLLSVGIFSLAATVLIVSRMVWLLCLIGINAGETFSVILKNILVSILFALPVFLMKYSSYSAPVVNVASAAVMASLYYLIVINVDENVYMEFKRAFPSKPKIQKMITILRFGRPYTPC